MNPPRLALSDDWAAVDPIEHDRIGIALLAVQMVGTFLPLVLLPEVTFTVYPLVPTLEGQYIIKNIIVIGAAITVGSTLPPVDRQ